MNDALQLRMLGGCDAVLAGRPVDLGGPRQRAVLALLVAAGGEVVPAERVTDDLWRGEPPPRALGALQAYVSHLRRALEPDRAPRAPATVLVSASPGYAVRLPVDQVDAWHFEALVRDGVRRSAGDPAGARDVLGQALALWAGTPYAPFADEAWASGVVARLEEQRRVAVEHLAEADLALGAAVSAVDHLEPHAARHPLRENAWRLLALALYRSGRQADALAALRSLRRHLADELGVDPSPVVQRLEADILDHAPVLESPAVPGPATAPEVSAAPLRRSYGAAFVGRDREVAALLDDAHAAQAGGVRLALVAGEPGAGKSALVEEVARRLPGWRVAWGRCPEVEGAPPLYPWSELVRGLTGADEPASDDLLPLLDDSARARPGDVATQRFRLHRAVGGRLRDTALRQPLMVVLDDLHRADDETLALLVDVLGDLGGAPVLLVGIYRSGEISPALAMTFASVAGRSPTRVELGGLGPEESAALAREVAATELEPGVLESIVARTEGNPFFLREAARLAAAGEAEGVPDGVRDVIHRRVARLPATAHTLLRTASLLGRDVDVDLLLALVDAEEEDALDAVDSALVAGLLEEPEPGRLRFSHALVQETVYSEISLLRRARWHARVGAALERLRPGDHAALAYHYRLAGPGHAERTVQYCRLAAAQADRRHAYAAAVELWQQAIAAERSRPEPDLRELVDLHLGLVRTHGHSGNAFEANRARREAIEVARPIGDPELLARAITAWDSPALWTTHPYGEPDTALIADVTAALDGLPETDQTRELRCRLLTVLALETEGQPDEVVRDAPARSVALAREIGDPELLCTALDGYTRHGHGRLAPAELDAVGDEVLEIARRHSLAAFEGMGHMLVQQGAASRGDLAAAEFHGQEMDRLGRTYGLPGLRMVAAQVPPLVAFARGDLDEAERLYREFGEALASVGALSVDIFQWDVQFLVAYERGSTAALADVLKPVAEWCPPMQPLYLHALIDGGRLDEARALWPDRREPSRDIMWGMYCAIDADNTIAIGSSEDLVRAYDRFSLIAGALGGARSGFFTLHPVDSYLARLAESLGRTADARAHWERARELADRVGNPRWRRLAQAALDRLEGAQPG